MSIAAIVPMKNELGNVELMVSSAHKIGKLKRVVFIDGNSSDGTFESLKKQILKIGDNRMFAIQQTNASGKFNAIKQAAEYISEDSILIWDGDNTIPLNDVIKIVEMYRELTEETTNIFIVANRITQQKQKESFRSLNLLGNHLVSFAMRFILRYRVPDVLSGVKIFPSYILTSASNCKRAMLLDNFGDLVLLSNGAKCKVQIISVPCNYKARFYGKTSIGRWKGGYNMLKVILHIAIHGCSRT
jgi:glycosyltransferase involved in cell wall biosynthesis